VPQTFAVIQDLPDGKHRQYAEKLYKRFYTSELASVRVCVGDNARLLRSVSSGSYEYDWRNFRAYMHASAFGVNGSNELEITGVLRGAGLSANQLVHLTGYGDFAVERVVTASGVFVADAPESLEMLADVDPFAAE
jgi:hypothetical protein